MRAQPHNDELLSLPRTVRSTSRAHRCVSSQVLKLYRLIKSSAFYVLLNNYLSFRSKQRCTCENQECYGSHLSATCGRQEPRKLRRTKIYHTSEVSDVTSFIQRWPDKHIRFGSRSPITSVRSVLCCKRMYTRYARRLKEMCLRSGHERLQRVAASVLACHGRIYPHDAMGILLQVENSRECCSDAGNHPELLGSCFTHLRVHMPAIHHL